MLIIRLFWKEGCGKCPMAKRIVNDSVLKVESYNIDDVEGMAMAAFHMVMATPTILILDDDDKEEYPIYEWRGELPTQQELNAIIKKHQEGLND